MVLSIVAIVAIHLLVSTCPTRSAICSSVWDKPT